MIYRLTKINGKPVVGAENKTLQIHPSLNAAKLTSLQPNSQYVIYVKAFNEIGDGVASKGDFGGKRSQSDL